MKPLKLLIVAAILATATTFTAPAQAQNAAPTTPTPTIPTPPKSAAPEKAVADIFNGLLKALADDDYAAFVAPADTTFKAALSKAAFEGVVGTLGVRVKAGATTSYMDKLKRQGTDSYLWKMQFADGGDELIALLAIKDGKVAGFFMI